MAVGSMTTELLTEVAVKMGANACVEMRQEMVWDHGMMPMATTVAAGSMTTESSTKGAV